MKVLVTGATGFIGRNVVEALLQKGVDVTATSMNADTAKMMPWYPKVEYIPFDYCRRDINYSEFFGSPDAIIHLAWDRLSDYRDPYHMEVNLPSNCHFLKNFIDNNIEKIVITGTCFEYGMQCGCLHEALPTHPITQYSLAKDTLRKYLELLVQKTDISFNWVRLFYLYGEGQSPNSLHPQLEKAISEGRKEFNMSGGEQLRDYISVKEAAYNLGVIACQTKVNGIVNCCSGEPVSIRRVVEEKIKSLKSDIKLNLGYYSYPEYEPMAFWGDTTIMKTILELR